MPNGHELRHNGQKTILSQTISGAKSDIVLEKSIFSDIFEEDIRKVYIYKKAERLAKALRLITPAFSENASFKNRIDDISLSLIDLTVSTEGKARLKLAHDLLSLLSILSVAKVGRTLSAMNVDIISTEIQQLLHELLRYEDPQVALEEVPSLPMLAKNVHKVKKEEPREDRRMSAPQHRTPSKPEIKKDMQAAPREDVKDRRERVVAIIKDKGEVSIKDISTLIRDVSEKTIQRELQSLINEGMVSKRGERRWSMYSLLS